MAYCPQRGCTNSLQQHAETKRFKPYGSSNRKHTGKVKRKLRYEVFGCFKVCDKQFNSRSQLKDHMRSMKHIRNYAALSGV